MVTLKAMPTLFLSLQSVIANTQSHTAYGEITHAAVFIPPAVENTRGENELCSTSPVLSLWAQAHSSDSTW